jgi:hypothetical protein
MQADTGLVLPPEQCRLRPTRTIIHHFLNLSDHPRWRAHRHTPWWDITRDHTARTHRRSLTNGNARQNDNVPTDPAIVANGDGAGILDMLPSAAHIGLVSAGEDADVWADHGSGANGHYGRVEDVQVDVGVYAVAQADIAPQVDVEGRLDEAVLPYGAENIVELSLSVGRDNVEVRCGVFGWKPAVVFVAPSSGSEACVGEFEGEAVESVAKKSAGLHWDHAPLIWSSQHSRYHLLVVVAPRDMVQRSGNGYCRCILLRARHC